MLCFMDLNPGATLLTLTANLSSKVRLSLLVESFRLEMSARVFKPKLRGLGGVVHRLEASLDLARVREFYLLPIDG